MTAQQVQAAATAVQVAPTTLYLREFGVTRRHFHDRSLQSYMVSISLTATLDAEGFVTDNQPFIYEVQHSVDKSTLENFTAAVIQLAKDRIGSRLARVTVCARELGKQGTVEASWPEAAKEQGLMHPMHQLSTISARVGAILVDNAVCGGYDGYFNTDISIVVDQVHAWTVLHNRIMPQVYLRFREAIIKASCEELCAGLAHIAIQIAGQPLVSFSARVQNLTGYAEIIWYSGQAMPPFPRLATQLEAKQMTQMQRRPRC